MKGFHPPSCYRDLKGWQDPVGRGDCRGAFCADRPEAKTGKVALPCGNVKLSTDERPDAPDFLEVVPEETGKMIK